MRILLINPIDMKNCAHIVVQPLGLMYIASALRNRFDHEIRILDMKVQFMSEIDAMREIKKFSPDLVGIRMLTAEAEAVHDFAGKIRKKLPHCKIIVGGPHTVGSPKKILSDPNIDFIVRGEGENTACELVAEIEKGNEFPDVPGIGYARNGEMVITQPRELVQDLDSLPFPAWDLIDIERYFKIPNWNFNMSKHMAVFTSRGCPYRCAYCHNVFGKKTRFRSPENVMEEIDILYGQYGIRELKIIDDIFNINKPRVHKICDTILERGYDLDICFPNGLRGDIMDKPTLQKLKAAGTFMITYAVETASPRVQKLIKKNIRLDRLNQVINDTVEAGIFTKGFFMMGFPSETCEEIHTTAHYALSSKLHWLYMFVVNPYEGTEMADMAIELGIIKSYDDLDFSHGYKRSPVQLSEMPVRQIKRLQLKTLGKFFLNPSRLYSAYACTQSKKQYILWFFFFLIKLFLPTSRKDKWIRTIYGKMFELSEHVNGKKSGVCEVGSGFDKTAVIKKY